MAYVTYIEDLGRFFFSCKILRLSICGYDILKTTIFLLAPYSRYQSRNLIHTCYGMYSVKYLPLELHILH